MWETLGLRFPNVPVCPGHSTPFAALCDAFFARHPVSVWKASRAFGGKTNLMGALAFAESVLLRASVTILGGSGEQAERVHEYLRDFWRRPRAPIAALLDDPSGKRTRLIWGNTVQALMASQRSVSGPHPQRLRIDEADLVDLKLIDQSFGQPMTKHGVDAQIVVSSAHYEPDGTLTEMLKRAQTNGWSTHEWCLAADTMIGTPSGPVVICDLKKGDEVYAFNGTGLSVVGISDAWSNGVKRTMRLVTDCGAIECTPEHKVLTSLGWMAAGDVKVRMRVWCAEADSFPDVSSVLQERLESPQQSQSEHHDAGSMRASEAVGARDQGRSRAEYAGSQFFDSGSSGQVRGGLLPAGLPAGGGVLRTDAPLHDERNREGQGESYRGGGGGEAPVDSQRLGYALVVEVADGRDVDVWDVAVPGLHNFIANGLVVHNCWKECVEPHGWLPVREVQRTRSMVTAEMWRVQYDGQEPSPEGRAIDPAKVERMFGGAEIEVGLDDVPYREYEPPVDGASYATGADWARHRDYVEIVTLRDDVMPLRLVAYQRFRKRPTPYILQAFERQTGRYPGEAAHDATGGGNYIDDFLADPVEAVVMVGMTRKDLFTNYFVAIEHEMIVAPRIVPLYRQHKFVRNDDIWRPGGHPPDGVVACAMAYKASNRKPLMLLTSKPSASITIYTESGANALPVISTDADPQTAAGRMLGFLRRGE